MYQKTKKKKKSTPLNLLVRLSPCSYSKLISNWLLSFPDHKHQDSSKAPLRNFALTANVFPQFSLPPPTRLISVFARSETTSFENEGEELYIVPEKGMEITGSVR